MIFRKLSRAQRSPDRPSAFRGFLLAYSQVVLDVGKGRSQATSVPSFQESRLSCDSQIQFGLQLLRPPTHLLQTAAIGLRIVSPTEFADLLTLIRGSSR